MTVSRADYEDSTSNLKRHVKLCVVNTPEAQAMENFTRGVTYSWPRMRYLIAMWCACRHHPFSLVEDREFQEIFQMLYPKVRLPSRFTVSRDVRTVTDSAEIGVIKLFAVRPTYLRYLCAYSRLTWFCSGTRGEGAPLGRQLDIAERLSIPRCDSTLARQGLHPAHFAGLRTVSLLNMTLLVTD